MKKLMFALALSFGAISLFAQDKKLNEIQQKYLQQKTEDAKKLIDQIIGLPEYEKNAEAQLWKSTLDAIAATDAKQSATCTNCLESAYEAFKKYEKLDVGYDIVSQIPFQWKPLSILYDNYYNKGVVAFKAKEYETSYANFEKCTQFSKIIMDKNLKNNGGALDTIPFLYAGYAAQNAKKYPEAIKFLKILADKKYAVKEDAELYKLLLSDFIELNDKSNFDKYIAIAQEVFPTEDYQPYKMEYMNRNSTLDDKLNFYTAEDAKNTLRVDDYMYFGGMFSQHNKEDKEMLDKNPAKKMLFNTKAREAFTKAYKLNNTDLVAFNVGLLYYNEYTMYDDQQRANIKSMQELNANKPVEKDPKKKAAVEAKFKEQTEPLKKANADLDIKMIDVANSSVEWLEKFANAVKDKSDRTKLETQSLKYTINYLTNLFAFKMDKARGKDVKAYDAAEAKYKLYDALYDKVK